MSSLQSVKTSFKRRLLALVRENLFGHFETTINEYEEEIDRKRKLLEMIKHPDLKPRTTGLVTREEIVAQEQRDPESPHAAEETGQSGDDGEDCGGRLGLTSHLREKSHKNFKPPSHPKNSHVMEKPFGCHVCGKTFSAKKTLLYHLTTHAPLKPLSCSVCGMMLKNKLTLKNHMGIHTGIKPHKCNVCHKRFRLISEYKVHKRVHEHRGLVPCPKCDEIFPDKALLRKHMETHSAKAKKLFKCDVCSLELRFASQLKEHKKIHKEEKKQSPTVHMELVHSEVKPFSCCECGQRFFWSFQLRNHKCPTLTLRGNGESGQSELTQMETPTDADFWKDTRTHPSGVTYQRKNKVLDGGCNTENKPSASDVSVKTEPKDDESVDSDSSKENKKMQMGVKTEDEEDWDAHSKPLGSSERREPSEDHQALQARLECHMREKPLSCFFCEKRFIRGGFLTKHVSVHTGEQLLTCIICEKSFTTETRLIRHECAERPELPHCLAGSDLNSYKRWNRHSEENVFICAICGERCPSYETLNLHIMSHAGDKSLNCSLCNKEFSDKESLSQHISSHADQTQFKCVICKERFVWRRCLIKHMEIHKNQGQFACTQCYNIFSSRADLALHVCGHKRTGAWCPPGQRLRISDPPSRLEPAANGNASRSTDSEDSDSGDGIEQRPSGSTHVEEEMMETETGSAPGQFFNYQSDDSVDSDFWKEDEKGQSSSLNSLMEKQSSRSDAAREDSGFKKTPEEKEVQESEAVAKFMLSCVKKEDDVEEPLYSWLPVGGSSSSTGHVTTANGGEPEPDRKLCPTWQPETDNKASDSSSLNSVAQKEIAERDVGCDKNSVGCSDVKSEPDSDDSDFWKFGFGKQ